MLFFAKYSYDFLNFVRYNRDSNKFVRNKHEILSSKHVEPNQMVAFVRYNREFVITVIVITEFDCICEIAFYTTFIQYHSSLETKYSTSTKILKSSIFMRTNRIT